MKQLFIASLLVGLTAPAFASEQVSHVTRVAYKGKGVFHMVAADKPQAAHAASFKHPRYVKR